MEIIRDRSKVLLWLSQTAYIDKIAKLGGPVARTYTTPMGLEELMPRSDQSRAAPHEIQKFQRKIGSILYAAVSTRPDVAFAASRLARFLVNPNEAHHAAADRVLQYLQSTREMALRFGGGDGLTVATDASFADNSIDRRSSQAFAMTLFGGLVGWRANKQDTVTTSTTEAELLAMAQAVKETLYVHRLVRELGVNLDQQSIAVECDNKQTIGLVTKEIAVLKTKLRHVDVHNHWLRQAFDKGDIHPTYTESAKMKADCLTKALPPQRWEAALEQLGLENKAGSGHLIDQLDGTTSLEEDEFDGSG